MNQYFVYLMASQNRVLYVGMTNNIVRRVYEHKNKTHPESFTAKYKVKTLVYWEEFRDVRDAIAREKAIKGWRRSKKVELVESNNPKWLDLSSGWE